MIDQRVALITGANKGIGLATAKGLAAAGLVVFVGARDVTRGEAAVAELRAQGADARFVLLDVRSEEQAAAAHDAIDRACGRLDILVNNAATALSLLGPTETSVTMLRDAFETNLYGHLNITKAMLPLLRKPDFAQIVNVSSDFGSIGFATDPAKSHWHSCALAYPASKAALNMFTVQLAKELRESGIRVNSVNPGFTDTDMTAHVPFTANRNATEAAGIIISAALAGADGPTGTFFDADGELDW